MNSLSFNNKVVSLSLPIWNCSSLIKDLSSKYCMCHPLEEMSPRQDHCTCSDMESPAISCPQSSNQKSQCAGSKMIFSREKVKAMSKDSETSLGYMNDKSLPKVLKKRRRSTRILDIRQNLLELRKRILDRYVTRFRCSSKKARTVNKKQLRRRSRYIGVSRNNNNWQALINVGQVKNYIGTFADELEAARAYDLYSVAIRGQMAALNFNYTSQQMLERIDHYILTNSNANY